MNMNGQKNPKIDPNCKNLFRFTDTIFPKACADMVDIIGDDPSTFWIKYINDSDWSKTTCIYESEVMEMVQCMIAECVRRKVGDNRISLSTVIDSTKLFPVL